MLFRSLKDVQFEEITFSKFVQSLNELADGRNDDDKGDLMEALHELLNVKDEDDYWAARRYAEDLLKRLR